MSQEMKNNRRQTQNYEDPYERGFSHKLYEDDPYEAYYGQSSPKPSVPRGTNAKSSGGGRYQGSKSKKKKTPFITKFFRFLLVCFFLFAIGYIALRVYVKPPMYSSENHLDNSATILIAGTDQSELNTDTLMLVNFNRNQGKISIMSIPRDTRVDSKYTPHKINGAYAANGGGEEGMFWLCDYVRQCVGFQPDAYVLVNLDCFAELVDLFGGVEFNVPMDMHYEDPSQDLYIHLEKGLQTLTGEQAIGVVRFRKGYAMQDLDRVKVQRDFIMTALNQWKSPKNILKASKALSILKDYSLTNLKASHIMWLAESFLICGTDDMMQTTIPHTLGRDYVYIKADQDYLDLLNQSFNPYEDPISPKDLHIVD